MPKPDYVKEECKQEEPVEYQISVLHNRPKFRESVKFLSTYYAKETKDEQVLKQIFTRAFQLAHPTWKIKEVKVDSKTKEDQPGTRLTVEVLIPEEAIIKKP